MLPSKGVEFFRAIVRNVKLDFKKDAACPFMENPRHKLNLKFLYLPATCSMHNMTVSFGHGQLYLASSLIVQEAPDC